MTTKEESNAAMGKTLEGNKSVAGVGNVPEGWQRDAKTGKLVPVKGEVLTFDFEPEQQEQVSKKGMPKSLQERFSSFRKDKIKAARSKAFQAEEDNKNRQDTARMDELREKFVERCKAYYGVPYAKRYHEPGTEHYNAPLYLDCCGLVRQVLRDLKEDFGFTTGPWNQAYQFDTLPIRYDSWEQMKPGDLVFAEGKVTKPGMKQQKGNIVHVEVFLGGGPEGKSVCGARWGKGVVQEFESFDFKAKSWDLIQWHFCSIDTWLGGTCRSFHPTREWKRREWTPGAKSVFAAEDGEEEEEDAEGAEGAEEEEGEAGVEGKGGKSAGGEKQGARSAGGGKRFFVSPGNQSDLVITAMEGFGWERIPFDQPDDLSFHLRWTEVRSDIHYGRLRSAEQLVNHFPDANVITTKHGLLRSLRDLQRRRQRAAAGFQPQGLRNLPDFLPPTYSLSLGSDKVALLRALQAAERGQGPTKDSIWVVKPVAANQGHGIFVTRDYRMLIHDYLGWRSSSSSSPPAQEVAPAALASDTATPPPASDSHSEAGLSERDADSEAGPSGGDCSEDAGGSSSPPGTPSRTGGGGAGEASAWEPGAGGEEEEGGAFVATPHADSAIVQQYLRGPLLVGGAKFDLRCYMLIASSQPAYLVLFHDGYARRSLSPYSEEDLTDRFVHLTNAAVQKKHAEFKARGEEAILSMPQLQAALEAEGSVPPHWAHAVLRPQLQALCREVFLAAQAKLVRRRGVFELFGLDFMVDAQLQPWLLEVNSNPALWIHSAVQRELLPALVRDTLSLVIELQERTQDSDQGVPAEALERLKSDAFSILFDGAKATPEEQFPPLR